MSDIIDIKTKAVICVYLMTELWEKLKAVQKPSRVYSGVENYTQYQEEIRLIRRELMELSEMIGPPRVG